jgi:sodium/hydrogen antiporter
MSGFTPEVLVPVLALVGIVIIIAGLFSGIIERIGFPQVALFLLIGAGLGPAGINILNITLVSPILNVVATLGLVLVLFTDAISLNLHEVRQSSTLALLVLGPGTLLSAVLIAILAWWLLDLSPAASVLLGAVLASTDPVLLRGLLRRDDVPGRARQALRLESGLNDIVLLPIVLVAMNFLDQTATLSLENWARLALDLLILGPGAGILVGVCGVATLVVIRQRVGIRRDYESLFSLGLAFTAYAAAEAVHGSGFLAAFAAGFTITLLDVELCDCFLEYGETTAELTLLLTFVLFGSSLIWNGFTILNFALIVFVILALLVRPFASFIALARVKLSKQERLLIAWFGPRGLSSMLLVLLPVFSGIPNSQRLFVITSLVVVFSVIIHGGSPMILIHRQRAHHQRVKQKQETFFDGVEENTISSPLLPQIVLKPMQNENIQDEQSSATSVAQEHRKQSEESLSASTNELHAINPLRISLPELQQLQQAGEQVILLDSRTDRTYMDSNERAEGAIRLRPDRVEIQARELNLPQESWLIVYCA